jgi:tetratricopeptide (TPR) repeat protein
MTWLFVLYAVVLIGVGVVIWQFNTIQPAVLALVGISTTPTPTILEAARQGDLAFWRGDLDASISHYQQALAMAPDNLDIRYELVRMLVYRSFEDDRDQTDAADAQQLASQAVTDYPNNARALALNCLALMRVGRSEEAAQFCNRAIGLNGEDANAYAYLAQAYYDLSRYDVAAEAGLKALNLNPESIEANTAYAFILFSQRRTDSAMQYFTKAAAINQRLEFPYFNLGAMALGLALNQGDDNMYQLAIKSYDTVLAMNKRSVKAYISLCRAYMAKGEPNLARDDCITATDLDSTSTSAWRWLGEIYYRNADYEEAIKAFEQCATQEADLPVEQRQSECWYFRGLAHVSIGDCTGALPIFSDVLNWTRSTKAIELVNTGIRLCTGSAPTTAPTQAIQTPGG